MSKTLGWNRAGLFRPHPESQIVKILWAFVVGFFILFYKNFYIQGRN
jgi:hypothetical protein